MRKVLVLALAAVMCMVGGVARAGDDNEASASQSGKATTGDAVGGISAGIVSSGGSVNISATNRSEDVEVESGDVSVTNSAKVKAYGATGDGTDDNTADLAQSGTASSGDAVGGLVAGVTSNGGDVDAVLNNESLDVGADTGDSSLDNSAFVRVALSK